VQTQSNQLKLVYGYCRINVNQEPKVICKEATCLITAHGS